MIYNVDIHLISFSYDNREIDAVAVVLGMSLLSFVLVITNISSIYQPISSATAACIPP